MKDQHGSAKVWLCLLERRATSSSSYGQKNARELQNQLSLWDQTLREQGRPWRCQSLEERGRRREHLPPEGRRLQGPPRGGVWKAFRKAQPTPGQTQKMTRSSHPHPTCCPRGWCPTGAGNRTVSELQQLRHEHPAM